jgi:hypothetical protein
VTQSLYSWDWVVTLSNHIEHSRVGLNDIDAYSWNTCEWYSVEKHNIASERKERAERAAAMLGKK